MPTVSSSLNRPPQTPLRLVPKPLKPRLHTSQRFSWKMAASELALRIEGEPFNANATAVITNRMPSLLSEYCCYAQIHKQLEACEFLSEPVRFPMAERFVGTAGLSAFSPSKDFQPELVTGKNTDESLSPSSNCSFLVDFSQLALNHTVRFGLSDHESKNEKCCIYIAPFPYEYAQRRITMISLPPANRLVWSRATVWLNGTNCYFLQIAEKRRISSDFMAYLTCQTCWLLSPVHKKPLTREGGVGGQGSSVGWDDSPVLFSLSLPFDTACVLIFHGSELSHWGERGGLSCTSF